MPRDRSRRSRKYHPANRERILVSVRKCCEDYKDKIIFVLFFLQVTLFYNLIQTYFPTGHIFKIPLIDEAIPFLSVFVIPYLLFIFVLFLPFAMAFRDKKRFLALSASFLFASVVCNIVYVLFQTTALRPEVLPSTIFDELVLFVYAIDKPLNLFPSGHVTFSVLSTLCLTRINKKLAYAILPVTILIVLSTLFIKQHYVPDVLGGLALAFLSFQIFRKTQQ
jgi:membrane-associated phospholipid phosphatase